MKNRIGRIIIAIVFLIGFAFYTYDQEKMSKHSVDVESWGEAGGLKHEEFDTGAMDIEENLAMQAEQAAQQAQTEAEAEPEPTPEAEPEAPALPEIDITSWEYVLVNDENRLDSSFAPPNVILVRIYFAITLTIFFIVVFINFVNNCINYIYVTITIFTR